MPKTNKIPNNFMHLIFICFIVYGITEEIFGSIWPRMSSEIGLNLSLLGIVTMTSYISSGFASFFTYKIRMKLGTNYSNVLALSCTLVSMLLLANARNFITIVIATIFLGLGLGILDANSNSYIVKAYNAEKVSFMYAFWGLGATIGPLLMSFAMLFLPSYRWGFYIASVIIIIVIILLLNAKRTWQKLKLTLDKNFVDLHSVTEEEKSANTNVLDLFKIKNAVKILFCFFFATCAGCTLPMWISSISVGQRAISHAEGAMVASIFCFSIMIGRVVFGILATKFKTLNILLLSCILSTILSICFYVKFQGLIAICIHAALLGFVSGPETPLLNASLKELFDNKYLSMFISMCDVFSLVGMALGSLMMTLVSDFIGIQNVHIVQIFCFAFLTIIFYSVQSNNASKV